MLPVNVSTTPVQSCNSGIIVLLKRILLYFPSRTGSLHNQRYDSVKRVAMDLRIPSFDDSCAAQKSKTLNENAGNFEKPGSEWAASENEPRYCVIYIRMILNVAFHACEQ